MPTFASCGIESNEIKNTMDSKLCFLLPLCHARDGTNILTHIGANPIFDRNVIGLVAQFTVGPSVLFLV